METVLEEGCQGQGMVLLLLGTRCVAPCSKFLRKKKVDPQIPEKEKSNLRSFLPEIGQLAWWLNSSG